MYRVMKPRINKLESIFFDESKYENEMIKVIIDNFHAYYEGVIKLDNLEYVIINYDFFGMLFYKRYLFCGCAISGAKKMVKFKTTNCYIYDLKINDYVLTKNGGEVVIEI